MTSHERLMRIFGGKEVDRPSLKLWGAQMGQKLLDEKYRPVYDLAMRVTDLFDTAGGLNLLFGSDLSDVRRTEHDHPLPDGEWVDRRSELTVGGHTMHAVHRYSRRGAPGYDLEHYIKAPEDLKAFLAHRYAGCAPDAAAFLQAQTNMGDRGVVMYGLDHAAYAAQRMMGSELFAYLCYDERELLKEFIELLGQRIIEHVKAVFSSGIRPVFAWVGPELCIPPLVAMRDFEEFVFNVDKPICDTIHNGGGYVWMHCHGRVGRLLERFVDMGIDVLNPIEPPPMGDITLQKAVSISGSRMGLEGNIEIGSLLLEPHDRVRELVRQAAEEGGKSSRFILCPSAGYMEYIDPSEEYIQNLMIYLAEGYRCLCAMDG